jgi:hypothetical protein
MDFMPIDASGMKMLDLFKRLNAVIRDFVNEVKEVVDRHEVTAPSAEIKELINSIKSRRVIDEKDKHENEEILKFLNQLSEDKRIFYLIKAESGEWIELLDAIEKRLEMDKDTLTKEELDTYEKIRETTKELKDYLRTEGT